MRLDDATAQHETLIVHCRGHGQAEHQLAVLLAEMSDRRLYAELG